ncbi:NAD(P)-binding protein [Rhizopus microsporus ATCC 52813]|uniref:NAD(P)-binding protein n=1 Tax=Rhizopus microsporus ATCC 52813 TaxID=1340429 RepID=A0A2G4SY13_RHIZD|nr:NAD(P)-binding protein [Rhizopus microsporus ATCC 52813]PHZ13635.1 NAD(P)-binding protein [Rhizopus microsporus ATCC 52813]
MVASSERVFVVGGTGNVGTKVVKDLVAKDIPVTLYARQPEKVNALFNDNSLISVVQGDYSDLAPLKEGLKGHTRLFLLIADLQNMVHLKKTIAAWAYEAGVKQVVDVSGIAASFPNRTSAIGTKSYEAEQAIYNLPNRGAFVALRPGRFMSNVLVFERIHEDAIVDKADPNAREGWVSTNDIGAIAAVILSEDIEKHGDSVYELISDVVTPTQRAEIFSRVLGRPIKYKKITTLEKYDMLMQHVFNHSIVFSLCTSYASFDHRTPTVTDGIQILLRREPETFEKFITDNKHLL